MPVRVALLEASVRERLFALALWKRGDVPGSYWEFLEQATYDSLTDEIVFPVLVGNLVIEEKCWRVEDEANP